MIRVTVEGRGAAELLARLVAGLTPAAIDPVVEKVALKTLASLVRASPKKWFGQIRSGWTITKPEEGVRQISIPEDREGVGGTSVADIARFVNFGTAQDGSGFIYPVKAKRLYIPLVRRAAAGWEPGFVYGTDYILLPRVHGIKGRHFIEPEEAKAEDLMRKDFRAYVHGLVTGKG